MKLNMKMPRRRSQDKMFNKTMDTIVDVTAIGATASIATGVFGALIKK
jgi:hypothetical protein